MLYNHVTRLFWWDMGQKIARTNISSEL